MRKGPRRANSVQPLGISDTVKKENLTLSSPLAISEP